MADMSSGQVRCSQVRDTAEATTYLRRDVLANQCLLQAIERNVPPVDRRIWSAKNAEGAILGLMMVEQYPHGPCVSLRLSEPHVLPELLKCLDPRPDYRFAIPLHFGPRLQECIDLQRACAPIVSMTVSDEDLVSHMAPGDVRRLCAADSALTDEFSSSEASGEEPPLSVLVAESESNSDEEVVSGLIVDGRVASFVQFGWVIDNIWEVGMIRTRLGSQGEGLAKALLASVSADLLDRQQVPIYQVSADNQASVRTATAVGYREIQRLAAYEAR